MHRSSDRIVAAFSTMQRKRFTRRPAYVTGPAQRNCRHRDRPTHIFYFPRAILQFPLHFRSQSVRIHFGPHQRPKRREAPQCPSAPAVSSASPALPPRPAPPTRCDQMRPNATSTQNAKFHPPILTHPVNRVLPIKPNQAPFPIKKPRSAPVPSAHKTNKPIQTQLQPSASPPTAVTSAPTGDAGGLVCKSTISR
jgi:hypothetical protein